MSITNGQQEMWTWAPEENADAATRTATELWNDPEHTNLKDWISVGEGVPLPRSRIQVVHGTVPQKCACNTLPARSGILYRPANEGLRCARRVSETRRDSTLLYE